MRLHWDRVWLCLLVVALDAAVIGGMFALAGWLARVLPD